jgi:enamine deaminase RidA (YjgF/YER057c/UK114 family)
VRRHTRVSLRGTCDARYEDWAGYIQKMAQTPDDRLRDLGLSLPAARAPLAAYVPMVVTGNLAFVAGHGPLGPDGRPAFTGRLGRDLSDLDAENAARLTTMNVLATLKRELGTLNTISRVVELRCFLVADEFSAAHLRVPLAVARLLTDVFGPGMSGGLTTIGVSACVLDLPVTVDLIAAVGA